VLGADALDAIKVVFEKRLDKVTSLDAKLQIAPDFPAVILPPTGGKRRPPPPQACGIRRHNVGDQNS
jgi:hypothetical protein